MTKGKHYSDEEIGKIVSLLGRGLSSAEIAEDLGRDTQSIRARISRLRNQVGKVRPRAASKPEQVKSQGGSVNFVSGAALGVMIGAALIWVLV